MCIRDSHIRMIRAVYFDQHGFRVSVKLIEGGIHQGVVSEAFELIDLCLETIAPRFGMIHRIDFRHNGVSFPLILITYQPLSFVQEESLISTWLAQKHLFLTLLLHRFLSSDVAYNTCLLYTSPS